MHFLALATDYDGTLATERVTSVATIAALERLKVSGRKLVLVTGRHLPNLKRIFGRLDLFERVVVENGGLLYHPATGAEKLLGAAPDPALVGLLRARGVSDLAVGRSIIATSEPFHDIVRDSIAELGLDLEIILNTDAVMVLEKGTNKASGLRIALAELGVAPEQVVAVGDAENDQVLLEACGCGVAVANALPMLKRVASMVTVGERGAGVEEVVDLLLHDEQKLQRLATEGTGLAI